MNVKKYLLIIPFLFFGCVIVYAAPPIGGYTPGATTDPDCAPGDSDCFVQTLVDTDDQTLSLSGFILTIQDGNSIMLPMGPTGTLNLLNGISGSSQTFQTGSIGTDFNIVSSGSIHTFNIPDAGLGIRGFINNLAQSIEGLKTFLSDVVFNESVTLGSALTDSITINGGLKILDGNQGTGKLLVSDGSGNATWQTYMSSDNQNLSLSGSNLSIANGNTVTLNYLSSFTELDPFYSASPAANIGTGSISNWNTAFSWGNHAVQGYLTGSNIGSISTPANGLSITGSTLSLGLAGSTSTGALSRTDWNTFNGKQNTLIAGAGISISGSTITNSTNPWLIGGNAAGLQALGSNDSALPFMSNGNIGMQLDSSNLSLSQNGSFVDPTGRNGLFIGNNNTYGNSENVLAIGETLDVRNGNKNIVLLGNQVSGIEDNISSFFAGDDISAAVQNTNVFAFGTRNSLSKNNNVTVFGEKNSWSSETNKFIVGNNDARRFQVDMDNGEILFDGSTGIAGQILQSQGAGVAPSWQNLPSGGITSLNSLSTNSQNFAVGTTGTGFKINSLGTTHTFNIPNATNTITGFLSSADWNTFNNKLGSISVSTPANGLSISGSTLSLGLAGATSTGALSRTDWNTFNAKIGLTSLSGISPINYNNTNGQISWSGSTTSVPEGSNLYFTPARFDSSFSGKTTSNLTEGTNLYFTNARGIGSTLTGFASGSGTVTATDTLLQAIQKLQGSNTVQDANIAGKVGLTSFSASGPLSYNSGSGLFSISQANTTTNGFLSSTDWNTFNNKQNAMVQATTSSSGWLSSVDWNTFNNKLGSIVTTARLSGSGTVGNPLDLARNGAGTGQLMTWNGIAWTPLTYIETDSIFTASPSFGIGTGSIANWNTAFGWGNHATQGYLIGSALTGYLTGSKITSLNSLTGSSQLFATGSTGLDFNISSSLNTHTFNIPDASSTARGLVTIGTQTFTGSKIFSVNPTLSSMTLGSIAFFSTGGLISQNNANFFWDNANSRLGIGTNTPAASLTVNTGNNNIAKGISLIDGTGVDWRMYASTNSSVGGGPGIHIGGAITGAEFWIGGYGGVVSNAFQSPSSSPAATVFMTRGVTGQTGDFFQIRSTRAATLGDIVTVKSSGNFGIGTANPSSTLTVNGSIAGAIRTIAGTGVAIAITATDYTVIETANVAGTSFTLPAASTATGRIYNLINYGATAITVSNFNNLSNTAITTIAGNSSIMIQSDGTTWRQIQ